MEECLVDVKSWMTHKSLKMNDSKTEVIVFGTRQQLAKLSFNAVKVGDEYVGMVNCVRNLVPSLTVHCQCRTM